METPEHSVMSKELLGVVLVSPLERPLELQGLFRVSRVSPGVSPAVSGRGSPAVAVAVVVVVAVVVNASSNS